jgi:hypothetical protein
MMDYKFTKEMDEISGFGGWCEETCRKMLIAGINWLDAHPGASPEFGSYENIYGIIIENNEDAKSLTEAVVVASGRNCTGVMHQAVISHCLWIKKYGWDKYVIEMSKRESPT